MCKYVGGIAGFSTKYHHHNTLISECKLYHAHISKAIDGETAEGSVCVTMFGYF